MGLKSLEKPFFEFVESFFEEMLIHPHFVSTQHPYSLS
jgi:hypothetical protein